MAASLGYSSSIVRQRISSERIAGHSLRNVAVSKSHPLKQEEIKMAHQVICMKKTMKRKSLKLFAVPPSSSTSNTSSLSPAQTIMQFYSAINEKNLKQLGKLIAEDCFFQDYSFPKPFQGKMEVLRFLEQLMICMGDDQNMQFNVEHVCEGNDYTVAVNWHLDWKKIQVPFTRGCSCYLLSVNGEKLVIKKAQVLIESPIKLGIIALTTFKIMSTLFDAFPAATEWFLKSPHVIFQLLIKTYNICIKPIVSPFLAWYIKLLNFAAFILGIILKILYYLAKIFHM